MGAEVTNEEREIVFELVEGIPELIWIIGHMRIVCEDAHQVSYLDIIRWLKRNNLKGWNLRAWMLEKHDGSVLRTIAFVRMRVHSDFGVKKIFAKPLHGGIR